MGGFAEKFTESSSLDEWASWGDDRLYRWDNKVMP